MADSGIEGKGKKVIGRHGVIEKIRIDGSEANAAAIRSYNREHGTAIAIRQVKYLNGEIPPLNLSQFVGASKRDTRMRISPSVAEPVSRHQEILSDACSLIRTPTLER